MEAAYPESEEAGKHQMSEPVPEETLLVGPARTALLPGGHAVDFPDLHASLLPAFRIILSGGVTLNRA